MSFSVRVALHHRWRCADVTWRKSVGLRDGTFFERSHLTLQQWMVLMYWWCREYGRLLNHDAPLMLGGPGVVVHIDESLFRHKPKVEAVYVEVFHTR